MINKNLKLLFIIKNFFVFSIFILIMSLPSYANVAMPGFFNLGGSGSFKPTNEKEFLLSKNIQMKEEIIKIQLFKGFAVVKGEYNMMNYNKESITITTSFPKNSSFKNKINIFFSNLIGLDVKIDGKAPKIKEKEKWYEWSSTFKPNSITKIFVYYLVDTSNAILREGYDTSSDFGFSYILETGKTWKGDIEKGTIYIKLMDNLTIDDIYGILPNNFLYSNQDLIYSFKNLEPEPQNNIVIRYKKNSKDINLDLHEKEAKIHFQNIDNIIFNTDIRYLKKLNKDNFSPPSYTQWIVLSIILIICLILFLPIFLFIRFLIKKLRKKI